MISKQGIKVRFVLSLKRNEANDFVISLKMFSAYSFKNRRFLIEKLDTEAFHFVCVPYSCVKI